MTMNSLSYDELRLVADQRRRDLAATWGRPPVPASLRSGEPRWGGRWLRLRRRRRHGSVTASPGC